jgi:hypothetical protein
MTVAVCLKCGAFKHGAWTPCPACQFLPNDDESLTRHMLASDHHHDPEGLKAISERVKAGQPVEVPEDVLKAAWVSKADFEKGQRRLTMGCLTVLGVAVAVAWYSALR